MQVRQDCPKCDDDWTDFGYRPARRWPRRRPERFRHYCHRCGYAWTTICPPAPPDPDETAYQYVCTRADLAGLTPPAPKGDDR